MRENKKEYIVITVCPFCGHMNEVAVNEADYWDWDDGMLVQNAFPYLSADEREMLISGICLDCQKDIFNSDEEEDADYAPEDKDWYDTYLELGFNPYEGCYDWDC